MKSIGLILFLWLCYFPLPGQNYLSPAWRVCYGGNLADLACPDNRVLNTGISWQKQGFEPKSKDFWISNAFRAGNHEKYILSLDIPCDTLEPFINGVSLGAFPYRSVPERILVAPELLNEDKNEVIIKIAGARQTGGRSPDPVRLSPSLHPCKVDFQLAFPTVNQAFSQTDTIFIPISISSTFPDEVEGRLSVLAISAFRDTIYSYNRKIKINERQEAAYPATFRGPDPGFYRLLISFDSPVEHAQKVVSFAVAPTQIGTPPDRVSGLRDFWKNAKAELARVAPEYVVTKIDSLSTGQKSLYSVSMRSAGGEMIRGWYAVPKKPGRYPAVLELPGYGQALGAHSRYEEPGFIRFSLEIRGQEPGKLNKIERYMGKNAGSPEDFIYKYVYLDCLRAIDFLYSRPEVDKIAVYGASQGGGLAAATAAFYPEKVSLCVVAAPFLADLKNYFRIRPQFWKGLMENSGGSTGEAMETLSYFDLKNLAAWIQSPVFLIAASNDDICPPYTAFSFYNQVNAEKAFLIYPLHDHALPFSWHQAAFEWIRKQLEDPGNVHSGPGNE